MKKLCVGLMVIVSLGVIQSCTPEAMETQENTYADGGQKDKVDGGD